MDSNFYHFFPVFSDELSGFLNLTFSGFFHGPGRIPVSSQCKELFSFTEFNAFIVVNGDLGPRKGIPKDDFVKVDAILVKVCHKRRKVMLFPGYSVQFS